MGFFVCLFGWGFFVSFVVVVVIVIVVVCLGVFVSFVFCGVFLLVFFSPLTICASHRVAEARESLSCTRQN